MDEPAWGKVESHEDKMRILKCGVLLELEARVGGFTAVNTAAFSIRSRMTLCLAGVREGVVGVDELWAQLWGVGNEERNAAMEELHSIKGEARGNVSKKVYDSVFAEYGGVKKN